MGDIYNALSGGSPTAPANTQNPSPGVPPTGGSPSGSKYAGMPEYEQWRQANPHVPDVVADLAFENSQSPPNQQPSMPMTQALAPKQVDPYQNVANKATGQDYQ